MTITVETGPAAAPEPVRQAGRYATVRWPGIWVRALLIIPTAWFLGHPGVLPDARHRGPDHRRRRGRLTPAQIAERKAAAGFDRPLLSQYWDYLSGLFRGDFGTTLTDKRPITDILVVNGAATLELAFWSLLVALTLGIPGTLCRNAPRPGVRRSAAAAGRVVLRGAGVLRRHAAETAVLGQARLAAGLRAVQRLDRDCAVGVRPQTHIMIVDAILYGDPPTSSTCSRMPCCPRWRSDC